MISAVYYFGVLGALFLNITALALLVHRHIPLPATARAIGVIGACAGLFSIEHFIGLGDLSLLFLPITGGAAWLVWREWRLRPDPLFTRSQIVFLAAVAFAAACRLASPDIVEDNDRLTDLHLVANYMSGERLPPLDYWFPPQRLDYYYTFQHYSAALLGRFLGLPPGTSLNIAAILVGSLVLTLAWEFLLALRLRLPGRLLCIAALAVGGTGVSPLFHLVTASTGDALFGYGSARHALLYNSRFVGWFEDPVASDFWRAVAGPGTARAVLLPIETFGYQFPLGGYHAPLSGFLLLFLALAIMIRSPQLPESYRARLQAILGFTIPLTIVSNAWVFPLHAAFVAGWKISDWRSYGRRDISALAAGAVVGAILLMPALAGLAAETGHARPVLVAAEARTPVVQFLLVHWPLVLLCLMLPFAGMARSSAAAFGIVFLGLLLAGEFVTVSDSGYVGEFARFNPALKWWGWIFTGGVFALSALILAEGTRPFRIAAAVILALTATFAFDAGRFMLSRGLGSSFSLDGTGAYAADAANARIIDYLVDAPWGVVLEKVYREPPIDTGIYGSFARKPNVVGIPWVVNVWQRNLPDLSYRAKAVEEFYGGSQHEPLRFLASREVRYIVWSARESRAAAAWTAIDAAIGDVFQWVEFSADPALHIGLWERRDAGAQ